MATSLINTGIQFPDSSIQTAPSGIKSVQSIFANPKGTLTGDYGVNRAINVTISAVNTAKSIIFCPSGAPEYVGGYGAYQFISVTFKFINSTTVQLCPYRSDVTGYKNVRFQVVEFN